MNTPFIATKEEPGSSEEAGGNPSAKRGLRRAPSYNDEYLIYQALLGSIPENGAITKEYRERFAGYWTKALREAKSETTYDHPDEWYESSCQAFIEHLLREDSSFLADFTAFALPLIRESFVYSLSLLLLKLTAPGVPDIYQGAELWDTSLVDPDNRRPVDYSLRSHILQEIVSGGLPAAHAHRSVGGEKLFTIYHTLHYRNLYPLVFSEGEYLPLDIKGPLLGYIRRHQDDWALVLVPLLSGQERIPDPLSLTLPEGAPVTWSNLFTRESAQAAQNALTVSFKVFPVVLLTAKTGE